ncbi:unnamed protein product, partial [Vitis vinifera]|uniref:Uncharacterized protein n=1 Tax=Vitis vinifera TaxID=29760 RepID=D7TGY5_VITVI
MTKEKHMSGSNLGEGFKSDEKCPKVNWSQHANAHDNFLSPNKFLGSNFLFSLLTQRPCTNKEMGVRYVTLICLTYNNILLLDMEV